MPPMNCAVMVCCISSTPCTAPVFWNLLLKRRVRGIGSFGASYAPSDLCHPLHRPSVLEPVVRGEDAGTWGFLEAPYAPNELRGDGVLHRLHQHGVSCGNVTFVQLRHSSALLHLIHPLHQHGVSCGSMVCIWLHHLLAALASMCRSMAGPGPSQTDTSSAWLAGAAASPPHPALPRCFRSCHDKESGTGHVSR